MSKDPIQAILDERGKRYGSFKYNARISSKLYTIIYAEYQAQPVSSELQPHHLEALKMICHKIARIVTGDPNYADNWDDIAGYAQLGKEPR